MKKAGMLFFAAIVSLATTSCSKEETPGRIDQGQGVVIDGVMWAKFNVDAPGTFAPYAESTGMYYQWNRKQGWSSTDERVPSDWENTQAEGDVWAGENDPCPAGWRVPTSEQIVNLVLSGAEFTVRNGVEGIRFGSGENAIFLPAAGSRTMSGEVIQTGDMGIGNYWSADKASVSRGLSLNFSSISGICYAEYKENRTKALTVRCVAK